MEERVNRVLASLPTIPDSLFSQRAITELLEREVQKEARDRARAPAYFGLTAPARRVDVNQAFLANTLVGTELHNRRVISEAEENRRRLLRGLSGRGKEGPRGRGADRSRFHRREDDEDAGGSDGKVEEREGGGVEGGPARSRSRSRSRDRHKRRGSRDRRDRSRDRDRDRDEGRGSRKDREWGRDGGKDRERRSDRGREGKRSKDGGKDDAVAAERAYWAAKKAQSVQEAMEEMAATAAPAPASTPAPPTGE